MGGVLVTPDDPLAAVLQRARIQQGLTEADLAHAAGLTLPTCRALLRGEGVNLHTLRAVAAVVGLEVCLLPALARPSLRAHGTPAALARHRYHREPACDACKAWDRDRKRVSRAQAVDGPGPLRGAA